MRDDLHKGSTMGRHWSRVIRQAANDAAWESTAGPTIESALLREVREVLQDPAVADIFGGRQQVLLSPTALLPTGTGIQLLETLGEHLGVREAEGLRGRELLRQGLADALAEELEAKKRDIVAHVMSKHPSSVRELARRVSVAAAGAVAAAVGVVLGERDATRSPGPLDLDGDILGGVR